MSPGDLHLAVLHVLGMDEHDVVDHPELLEQHGTHQPVEVTPGHQPVSLRAQGVASSIGQGGRPVSLRSAASGRALDRFGAAVPGRRSAEGPVEAVEDQVEPELVLVAVVVAGLQDVLDDDLGEVRVGAGRELGHDRLGHLGGLLRRVERQAGLLQREPVDVAVEDRVGVGGQLDREARVPEDTEDGVVVSQVRGSGVGRDSIRLVAQGWRRSASRAEIARWRMAALQPISPGGSSISPKTTSMMPSRMASLPATWWYSDMASTPSSWASLRMLSDPTPSRSASATAACSTRCRSGGLGVRHRQRPVLASGLTTLRCTVYLTP